MLSLFIDYFLIDGNYYSCRRVIRPWLGLKMIDLNKMIIEQLKERDATFPDVTKGVLVAMVTMPSDLPMLFLLHYIPFFFLLLFIIRLVAIF